MAKQQSVATVNPMEHPDFVFRLTTDKKQARRFSKTAAEAFAGGIKFGHALATDTTGTAYIVKVGEFAYACDIRPRGAASREPEVKRPNARIIWPPAIVAQLGTTPDPELADKLGCTSETVRIKRRRLGIPVQYECRGAYAWTPDDDALVGTDYDYVIGDALGIATETVRKRRIHLGRPPKGTGSGWTPAMDTLVGTDYDSVIARKLGLSRPAVSARRRLLGRASMESVHGRPVRRAA